MTIPIDAVRVRSCLPLDAVFGTANDMTMLAKLNHRRPDRANRASMRHVFHRQHHHLTCCRRHHHLAIVRHLLLQSSCRALARLAIRAWKKRFELCNRFFMLALLLLLLLIISIVRVRELTAVYSTQDSFAQVFQECLFRVRRRLFVVVRRRAGSFRLRVGRRVVAFAIESGRVEQRGRGRLIFLK